MFLSCFSVNIGREATILSIINMHKLCFGAAIDLALQNIYEAIINVKETINAKYD